MALALALDLDLALALALALALDLALDLDLDLALEAARELRSARTTAARRDTGAAGSVVRTSRRTAASGMTRTPSTAETTTCPASAPTRCAARAVVATSTSRPSPRRRRSNLTC